MRLTTVLHAFAPRPQSWVRLAGHGLETAAFVAYWLAVVLPLAYLVVLPASAFDVVDLSAVLLLALVHAVAVVAGQYHEHDTRADEPRP